MRCFYSVKLHSEASCSDQALLKDFGGSPGAWRKKAKLLELADFSRPYGERSPVLAMRATRPTAKGPQPGFYVFSRAGIFFYPTQGPYHAGSYSFSIQSFDVPQGEGKSFHTGIREVDVAYTDDLYLQSGSALRKLAVAESDENHAQTELVKSQSEAAKASSKYADAVTDYAKAKVEEIRQEERKSGVYGDDLKGTRGGPATRQARGMAAEIKRTAEKAKVINSQIDESLAKNSESLKRLAKARDATNKTRLSTNQIMQHTFDEYGIPLSQLGEGEDPVLNDHGLRVSKFPAALKHELTGEEADTPASRELFRQVIKAFVGCVATEQAKAYSNHLKRPEEHLYFGMAVTALNSCKGLWGDEVDKSIEEQVRVVEELIRKSASVETAPGSAGVRGN